MSDLRDRAYEDAMLRMRWLRAPEASVPIALDALRAAADVAHAPVRAAIASGALGGAELRKIFDAVASEDRDHFVEEVLGIAYPPLDELALDPELIAYTPSGYDEIVHAFDVTGLVAGQRFVDVGSGTGKAVLLASLLAGADAMGIEIDRALHDLAERAAKGLCSASTFVCGDARTTPLPNVDVAFLYIPFTGATLEGVLGRLTTRYLCAGALDERRYPQFVAVGPPKSWLVVYASAGQPSVIARSSAAAST